MDPGAIAVRVLVAVTGFTGTILNSITLFLLVRTKFGSHLTTHLLRSQCVMDGVACFSVLLIKITGYSIYTGIEGLDIFFCHFWFEGVFFWLAYVMSVQNLVATAFDRLYAVVSVTSYRKNQRALIIGCYVYIICMTIVMAGPNFLKRRYTNGTCIVKDFSNAPELELFFQIHSYLWAIFQYIMPAIFFIASHGYIIYKVILSSRKNVGRRLEGPNKIRSKVYKLLRTTSIMASILLVFHLQDTVLYLLSTAKVVSYIPGSVPQQVGVLFIVLASNANPVVLITTLDSVKNVAKMYLCFFYKKACPNCNHNNHMISSKESL